MNFQKAIIYLNSSQVSTGKDSLSGNLNPNSVLIVTFLYLFFLLSVPIEQTDSIIWYAIYPIIMAPFSGLSYSNIFKKSLYVLPFIIIIGVFNPFFDHREAFKIGNFTVTLGMLTFLSLTIRGLLAVQAILILLRISGFFGLCNSLRKIGLPRILIIQLMLTYRYISVFLEEIMAVQNSIRSRGYGKRALSIKLWTPVVGSLFLRSLDKSKRIYNAMLSRGFDGYIPLNTKNLWNFHDFVFTFIWTIVFICLYYFDISALLFSSISV